MDIFWKRLYLKKIYFLSEIFIKKGIFLSSHFFVKIFNFFLFCSFINMSFQYLLYFLIFIWPFKVEANFSISQINFFVKTLFRLTYFLLHHQNYYLCILFDLLYLLLLIDSNFLVFTKFLSFCLSPSNLLCSVNFSSWLLSKFKVMSDSLNDVLMMSE